MVAQNKSIKRTLFDKIRSNYILKEIFDDLSTNRALEIIRYNKNIQNRLNKELDYYKRYLQIVIEIIPIENKYGNFINIINKKDEHYYHIYFNDSYKEIKKYSISEDDKIDKIKIAVDYEIKSLYKLFEGCSCIKIMNFVRFNRKLSEDMSFMFSKYSSIEEINFYKFKSNNVTNMCYMFYECSSLKKLDLSNFITDNVNDMRGMFYGCISLQEINLSNFNTNNVTRMGYMFNNCNCLSDLKLDNFNYDKVIDKNDIFLGYSLSKKNEEKINVEVINLIE